MVEVAWAFVDSNRWLVLWSCGDGTGTFLFGDSSLGWGNGDDYAGDPRENGSGFGDGETGRGDGSGYGGGDDDDDDDSDDDGGQQ